MDDSGIASVIEWHFAWMFYFRFFLPATSTVLLGAVACAFGGGDAATASSR